MKSGVEDFTLPSLLKLTPANINTIKEIYKLEKDIGITDVVFSPNGQYLAVARLDNTLHIWSTKDYQLIYTFHIEGGCGDCVAFSPDSRLLASIRETRPYDVIVWDLETGKSPWESMGEFVNHNDKISSLVFSPDGTLLVEAIGNNSLFWQVDVKGFELIREIEGHSSRVNTLAFSPDGHRLLTTSDDLTAKVWDVNTGNFIMTLNGHTERVVKGIYSPDNAWIITAGYDNTIRYWDSQTGQLIMTLGNHTAPVIALALSADGLLLISGGMDNQVIVWNAKTRNKILTLYEPYDNYVPLALSPDGKILITTNPVDTLCFWGITR